MATLATTAGGKRGWADGTASAARFDEPAGLSAAGNRLYVADTNNHLVRVVDLATKAATTLQLSNLAVVTGPATGKKETIALPPQQVSPGATTLRLTLRTPENHHLNSQVPSQVTFTTANDAVLLPGERTVSWATDDREFAVPIPVRLAEGTTTLTAGISVFYCRTGAEALCFIRQFEITLPVTVTAASRAGEIVLDYTLPPGS
jgi:hypothetical protein